MDTRRLVEGSRLVGATSWPAIATGVFVALAVQTVLLLLGIALGVSVGDRALEGGFAVWAVIVQLCSIALGAALAAALSHSDRRASGIAAGVMTWAVAIVLGGVLGGFAVTPRLEGAGAWTAFFGALLGLGAAILGGALGSSLHRSAGTGGEVTSDRADLRARPVGPAY